MRSLVPAFVALSLAGCASTFAARIEAASGTFEASRFDEVWDSAKAELERRGFEVKKGDRREGLMQTARSVRPDRVPCGYVTCRYRDEITVWIAPTGSATVRIARELALPTALILAFADWYPPAPSQKATIEGILAEQQDLLKAITAPRRREPGAPEAATAVSDQADR
jgi:hypothetical protein